MAILTKIGKVAAPLAGAIFIEPLLHIFAPSVKPFVRQFIQSDEAKQFLNVLAEGVGEASSGVCTEFLANRAESLLSALRKNPKLDEALIVTLRSAFEQMRADLRKRNPHAILDSFDQYFADWDERLKQIQADDTLRSEFLATNQFMLLFYEGSNAEIEEREWWASIKSELQAWTKYGSIPAELEKYLKASLLLFVNNALASTLDSEEYKGAWNEFQKSVGTQILFVLGQLESYIFELNKLARVSGGQFIKDDQVIEFSLRKSVDFLIDDLIANEIYIQRETTLIEENVKLSGLQDFLTRDGYFILAAPAGSGKSTLMAHWIREFAFSQETPGEQSIPTVCYHFYSKQEGTGDYNKGLTILSDQLLKALHIQANVNSFNPATIDSIISHSLELDHPGRLIVLVDGLDEAGEPSTEAEFLSLFKRIFPPKLGKNTTVILTVRDDEGADSLQHYQKEFGLLLNAFRIQEVTADALASYLTSTANIKLQEKAQQQDFIELIITKTEGLAIYIHYLLDELANVDEALWSEVIITLPKGFERYVSASLPAALAGNPHWEDALSFIALTQSPLNKQDLIALTYLSGNKLKNADFDRISWSIKRWLRSERDTWAFSHQKIGEVFYTLYVADDRPTYMEFLLAYCADWKQHESLYVLQNYANILRQEQREQQLYNLASDKDYLDLQRAKLFYYPTARLHTFQTAMLCATDKDNAAMMAKFSLIHAATAQELSVETWLEAYDSRGFSGALELADGFSDLKRRTVWYLLIAWKLVTDDRKKEAEDVLKSLDATAFPKLPGHLYFVAEAILPDLFNSINSDLIKSIYIKALDKSYISSANNAFRWLSQQLFSQVGDSDEAVQSNDLDEAVQSNDFDEAVQLGDFDEALIIARSLRDPEDRSQALGNLVVALARAEQIDQAIELFDEAVLSARSIEVPVYHNTSLGNLVTALAHPHLLDKAREFLRTIKGPMGVNPKLFMKLAAALSDAQYYYEAQQVADWIKDAWHRSQVLMNIAVALFDNQYYEESEELFDKAALTAHSIYDPGARSHALMNIALALSRSQQLDKAGQVFDEAAEAARSLQNLTSRYYSLKGLARTLFSSGFPERGEEVLLSIGQSISASQIDDDFDGSLLEMRGLDKVDQLFDKGAQPVDSISATKFSSEALMKLASALAHIERFDKAEELFDEAEKVANRIQELEFKGHALGKLAGALAHAHYFDKAKQMASSIKIPEARFRALREISVALARAKHFKEAEQIADAIKDPKFRTQALGNLAAALIHNKEYSKAKELYEKARRSFLSIKGTWFRAHVLKNVSRALADNIIATEIKKACYIKHNFSRASALKNIAIALSHDQSFEESRSVADLIEIPRFRTMALGELATALLHANQVDEAKELFNEVESIARSIDDFESRSKALGYLAANLARTKLFNEALRITKEVNGNNLLTVLDTCAYANIGEGLRKHIISLSYEIDSSVHACAQMFLLYEAQVDDIYDELRRYM